jgi:hypothetical protein
VVGEPEEFKQLEDITPYIGQEGGIAMQIG